MRLYKLTLSYGFKSYMTSRRPIGEREAIRHAAAVVGKLRAYTYKELETVRAAPELLGAPTIGRGSARPWGGGGEVIYTFTAVRIAKKSKTMCCFAHVLAYNSLKTPFFSLKYFTRYTHETFFEEYTNFEGHYLSSCRDIPLQSFGSHLSPQPHGLGLIAKSGGIWFSG